MKKRIRDKRLTIMFTDEEWVKVQAQMEKVGFTNFSAFARRILLGGLIVNVDVSPLGRALPLIGEESKRINQIAKELNAGREATSEDIEAIKESLIRIRKRLEQVKAELE